MASRTRRSEIKRTRARRSLVVLGAILGLFVGSLSAHAISNGWWAYNPIAGSLNSITFQRCGLNTDTLQAAQWSDANNLEPLDMSTAIFSCNTGNDYEREVNIFDGDYGDTSWAARWFCHYGESIGGNSICHEGVIQVHTDHVNSSSSDSYDKAVLCHEHGHSVGLAHNSISCMRNPATSASLYYAQAEKNELNNIY